MSLLENDHDRRFENRTLHRDASHIPNSLESASIPRLNDRIIDRDAPYFEGKDIAAGALASFMMLAPLAATAMGWGG